jgi:hypothetical protein
MVNRTCGVKAEKVELQRAAVTCSCPTCETQAVVEGDVAYCDTCGRVFGVPASVPSASARLPAGIELLAAEERVKTDRAPYRQGPAHDEVVDVVVTHPHRTLSTLHLSLALGAVVVALKLDFPPVAVGAVAVVATLLVARSLSARPRRLRMRVTRDRLALAREGVPLNRHFVGEEIEEIFVRAKARSDRPEERRYQLLLRDTAGTTHVLIEELADPAQAVWLAASFERVLGFEEAPSGEPP